MEENTKVQETAFVKSPGPLDTIKEGFGRYGKIAILYGIIYVFCRYRNLSGIAVIPAVLSGYAAVICYLLYRKIKIKPGSYYIIIVAAVIAVTSCRTLDEFIIAINDKIQFLLLCVFMIHQTYKDNIWNIGKYLSAICIFIASAAGSVFAPVIHLFYYLKNTKNKRCKNIIYVFIGIIISVPLILVMTFMLGRADAVFADTWKSIVTDWFRPDTLFSIIARIIMFAWIIYCLMCSMCLSNIKEENADRRNLEPVVAITCMGIISIIYVIFCAIQIIYLFMGKGTLPDNITYAEYAHEGFFQLLFVAAANLILVLLCAKYFRPNIILKLILSLTSICTYIMIVSAAKRMLLYISEYNLTLLRVLVLWFLAVLAILMLGVLIIIYKNTFPLFWYSLVVVSISYICLAWARPGSVIAGYNIEHISPEELTDEDIYYMGYEISDDACSILWDTLYDIESGDSDINISDDALRTLKLWGKDKSIEIKESNLYRQTLRTYNFSAEEVLRSYNKFYEKFGGENE